MSNFAVAGAAGLAGLDHLPNLQLRYGPNHEILPDVSVVSATQRASHPWDRASKKSDCWPARFYR